MSRQQSSASWERIRMRSCSNDEVLKGDARSAEKREAMCGKADIFFEMGASEPENYQRRASFTTNWRQIARVLLTGANKRFSRRVSVSKRRPIRAALATFYDVLEQENRPDERGSFFGSIKRALVPAACWKMTRNGNQRLLFTRNWSLPAEPGVKKPVNVSIGFGWSIFFGRNSRKCRIFCPCSLPGKEQHSLHDNYTAAQRVAWLVDSMRQHRDVGRVLRVGVCRSRQRSTA